MKYDGQDNQSDKEGGGGDLNVVVVQALGFSGRSFFAKDRIYY